MATITELREAMAGLAEDPKAVFIGQSVAYPGQRAHETFADVPMDRRIEMPICEDFTVGFAIGLSLTGWKPVVFIPRWDFLLCAANQLANHLDALGERWGAKVLIRTAVGASSPLDPGPQHTRDASAAFSRLFSHVEVHELDASSEPVAERFKALMDGRTSAVVVERMSGY